jgi:hypothetical protein
MSVKLLDNFEYDTDEAAQLAYVTNAPPFLSNADIDDEDMADITDWADADVGNGESTQATFDGNSCMKLQSGSTGINEARRTQDIGTFDVSSVVSIRLYCDIIGTIANTDYFALNAYNGTTRLIIGFASDGLFVYDGAAWNEVGTDLVVQDTWQEWTFKVNWTAQTVDVYLNKVLKASGVDCSLADATVNGTITFFQYGRATANRLSYIDWFKAGSDFIAGGGLQSYSESTIKTQGSYALKAVAAITDSLNKTLTRTIASPIDLSGKKYIKFQVRAVRTGSNFKIGFHDAGGTTTEVTPNIIEADKFQEVYVDISAVSDANKDAIDEIKITILNADAQNIIYLDNMYGIIPRKRIILV